ncbi:MAG: hypothetical protein B6229_09565 [Spirochaetaceae bacterium 4572_7]|nr:MAG: hypothetical protein B6229_09565 [Spirochaetaceae bacterium 4572_7]
MKKRVILSIITAIFIVFFSGCTQRENIKGIAIFIPGVVAGSPIYEELDSGVKAAALEANIPVKTIEGGFDAATWPQQLKELAATGAYDLIVSSNPSIPEIMQDVSKEFPTQKFLCLDGKTEGNPNIYTAQYKQFDQAYLAGYMAGLVTLSNMPGANTDKKVGFIIAYHYPVLDNTLIPGFRAGLDAVDPEIEIDLRIVGNWWDATKAKELTNIMINEGSDVFLSIAGSATQGVITQCQDSRKYLIYFDTDGFEKAPGTIIASTIIKQHKLSYKLIKDFITGELPFGKGETFSLKDGYIDFIQDSPLYIENVPVEIRTTMAKVVDEFK